MNVSRTNSQQNFTSTLIPYSSKKLVHTYLEPLNQYFIVRGFGNESVEALRNKINLSQAAIGFRDDGLIVVGKEKSADNFIGRILKKVDSDVKYVDDAPEMKVDGPVLDIFA